MRLNLTFRSLALTIFLCTPLVAVESPIVGTWLSNQRSKGGLGEIFQFKNDGIVVWTYGALLDGTLEEQTPKLVLTMSDPEEKPITFVYGFKDTDLELKDQISEKKLVMHRLKGANPLSIFGVWTYKHESGPDAFWEFQEGKRWYFSLPMQQANAIYVAKNGVLNLKWSGKPAETYTYSISGDRLTLTSKAGKKRTYIHKSQFPT